MKIRNILLTGGCGLTGRMLVRQLAPNYNVTHFELRDPGDNLPFIIGDIRDSATVAKACEGMDAVLHVAALHGKAWQEGGDDMGFDVNVTGVKNILEGAGRAGVQRLVFTSSIWASGHGRPAPEYLPIDEDIRREPAELYGLTKVLGEQMCRYASAAYGMSTIVLRAGGIRPVETYGPGQVGYLFGCVDVRDVVQAHILALEAPDEVWHDVFVIAADSPLCDVDEDLFKANPAAAIETVIPGAGTLFDQGELHLPAEAEWYSIAKARHILGYDPKYAFKLA